MPLDDADDERPEFRPPLPPDDRLWRHPSELASDQPVTRATSASARRPAPSQHDTARSRRRNLVASGVVLLGAAAVAGLVVLSGAMTDSGPVVTVASALEGRPAGAPNEVLDASAHHGATRAWLGVYGTDSDDSLAAAQVDHHDASGAKLLAIDADSPAARGGLRSGDVITAVDGQQMSTMADLVADVGNRRPGSKVEVTYRRDGRTEQTTVVLGQPPSNNAAQPPATAIDPVEPTTTEPAPSVPTPTSAHVP